MVSAFINLETGYKFSICMFLGMYGSKPTHQAEGKVVYVAINHHSVLSYICD